MAVPSVKNQSTDVVASVADDNDTVNVIEGSYSIPLLSATLTTLVAIPLAYRLATPTAEP